MNHLNSLLDETIVDLRHPRTASSVVIICEHASPFIPEVFDNLGVAEEALRSHVAWDPGALALAEAMAARLEATLIASKTSRLVYDCNRPPEAVDAMPARSEVVDVPQNVDLTTAQKNHRVKTYYEPFRSAVDQVVARIETPILITVHSFAPVYHGVRREVEIGILHDDDARLADAILVAAQTDHIIRRNEPYGPADGVTHTLKEHALPGGHLNVMLEVRNDLIADADAQVAVADTLTAWIKRALETTQVAAC